MAVSQSLETCDTKCVLVCWPQLTNGNNDWITIVIYSNRKLFISPVHDYVRM